MLWSKLTVVVFMDKYITHQKRNHLRPVQLSLCLKPCITVSSGNATIHEWPPFLMELHDITSIYFEEIAFLGVVLFAFYSIQPHVSLSLSLSLKSFTHIAILLPGFIHLLSPSAMCCSRVPSSHLPLHRLLALL